MVPYHGGATWGDFSAGTSAGTSANIFCFAFISPLTTFSRLPPHEMLHRYFLLLVIKRLRFLMKFTPENVQEICGEIVSRP